MTEDEFVALAAVAGWTVDICPFADRYSGIAVHTVSSAWYAETGDTMQQVVDRLCERVFP